MNIAEQITQLKTDFDEVYNAGKEAGKAEGGDSPFYYITTCDNILGGAGFPEGLEAVFRLKRVPISTGWMFNNSTGCKSIKLICDSEQTTAIGCESMFAIGPKTPTLELIDLTEFPRKYNGRIVNFCNKQTKLKTILGALDISEATLAGNMFGQCSALEDIEFVANTIPVTISFQYSRLLTVYSAKSIINALVNYAGTDKEGTYTLTFHADTWTKLNTEAPREDGLTWQDYVTQQKGWST
jgi:hypothetical protein